MKVRIHSSGPGYVLFYCPGCKGPHSIPTRPPGEPHPEGPHWTFDGNMEAPTFTPSVRHFITRDGVEVTTCHYVITAGKTAFCGDCQHSLSGQEVDMPDLPAEYADPAQYGF